MSGLLADERAPDMLSLLLERAGRGDAAAFDTVVRTTSGMLHAVALRVVGDRDQADDVVQEAYLEIWAKAARFDGARAPARTWITMTVRHRAIDQVRRHRNAHLRAAEYCLREYSPPRDLTSETAHGQMLASLVHTSLAGLEVEDREVLHLSYWAGYSQVEIAGLLGLSLGTVKSRIRRAKARLRACIAAEMELK